MNILLVTIGVLIWGAICFGGMYWAFKPILDEQKQRGKRYRSNGESDDH